MKTTTELTGLLIRALEADEPEIAWAFVHRLLQINQGRDPVLGEFLVDILETLMGTHRELLLPSVLLACPDCGQIYYSAIGHHGDMNYADIVIASPRCIPCQEKQHDRTTGSVSKARARQPQKS